MPTIILNGSYIREADFGSRFYYVLQLDSSNFLQLIGALQELLESPKQLKVIVGNGRLHFQTIPSGCTAKLINDQNILLQVDISIINNLMRRFQNMTDLEADPDYLVHTHLDNDFTVAPIGLSDIVFERIDEYHAKHS